MEFLGAVATAFHEGGIWMWAILLAQVATIAIVVDRFSYLYRKTKPEAKSLVSQFETDIRRGDLIAVADRAKAMSDAHPVMKALEAGSRAASQYAGQQEIQAKMDEVLLEQNSKLDLRIGFLAMLGNVATLLGLLGTITGMIKSFGAVAFVNPMEKATLLAQGISEAMNATAYGLIVAIPALALYAIFQNRAQMLSEDLNQASLRVFNWLCYSFENVKIKPARPVHSANKRLLEDNPTVS